MHWIGLQLTGLFQSQWLTWNTLIRLTLPAQSTPISPIFGGQAGPFRVRYRPTLNAGYSGQPSGCPFFVLVSVDTSVKR